MKKTKRQGLIITIDELHNIIEELESQITNTISIEEMHHRKFQINIINKTPEQSDTWEIESPKP